MFGFLFTVGYCYLAVGLLVPFSPLDFTESRRALSRHYFSLLQTTEATLLDISPTFDHLRIILDRGRFTAFGDIPCTVGFLPLLHTLRPYYTVAMEEPLII